MPICMQTHSLDPVEFIFIHFVIFVFFIFMLNAHNCIQFVKFKPKHLCTLSFIVCLCNFSAKSTAQKRIFIKFSFSFLFFLTRLFRKEHPFGICHTSRCKNLCTSAKLHAYFFASFALNVFLQKKGCGGQSIVLCPPQQERNISVWPPAYHRVNRLARHTRCRKI